MPEPHSAQRQMLHRISHRRIAPPPVTPQTSLPQLIDEAFLSYNAGRLRELCQTFTKKLLADDCVVGLTVAGALTPAGLGMSCLVPLIEAGFVDWIVSTGANMYHDLHFAFNLPLRMGSPAVPDTELRENRIVRIYDVYLHYDDVLLATDAILRDI